MNRSFISIAMTFLLGALVCGCATTGYEHADETSAAIRGSRSLAVNIQQNADIAVSSLESLTNQTAMNLRQPYDQLSRAVDSLASQAEDLPDHANAVSSRGNDYLIDWQKELASYQSGTIRTRSAERLNQVRQDLQDLNRQFVVATQSLQPLLGSLKDMQRYLATDLTAGGVQSIRDQIGGVATQAESVRQATQSLVAALDRVAGELSPMMPGTEPMGTNAPPAAATNAVSATEPTAGSK